MKKNVKKLLSYKQEGKKITAITAYDYSTAKYADLAGVDVILVGDSLAQVVLGYENTYDISLDEMKIFTKAVAKGANEALIVADMPFGSFQINKDIATKSAIELIKSGANAVKMEGAFPDLIETIKHLTSIGIPVMGHLGFTPMSVNTLGGHKVQGKNYLRTLDILKDAINLQQAGCFSIVLEMVPKESAEFISKKLSIPTIGIGAGKDCDGQIIVSDDILGKFDRFTPKFARKYANLKEIMIESIKSYCNDVITGDFPNDEESFLLDREELEKLENYKQNF